MKDTWISVKDKIPEENISVIGCDINGITTDDREPIKCHREGKKYYWLNEYNYAEYVPVNITHWMPLPEPPEDNHEQE